MFETLLGPSAAGKPRHATVLLAEVERAVAQSGGWDRVGRIAVGLGPGSFTGVRIGIATALGLAASRGLRPVGICTLDAIGLALREAGPDDRETLALIDARRSEVFAALYSPSGERIWEPLVATPAALLERLAGLPVPPLAGGSGALRFRDELTDGGVEVAEDAEPVHRVAARNICVLAAAAAAGPAKSLVPIYLRPPDAERWRERDSVDRAE